MLSHFEKMYLISGGFAHRKARSPSGPTNQSKAEHHAY
jgi:hypothetical protein